MAPLARNIAESQPANVATFISGECRGSIVFDSDSEYSGLSVANDDLQRICVDGATFTSCMFQGTVFADASMVRTTFDRCGFSGCDLSNVDLSDASLDSVVFRDSKLLGASFAEATIRSSQASGCLARLVSFFQASLRDTTFLDCDLTEADFREGRLVDTAVVRCDLSSVSLVRAAVQRLDIRGSAVNGSFSLADTKGFVVGTDQLLVLASALAQEVGTTVNDDELPALADLPGAGAVAPLTEVDPEGAARGLREARARLGQR